MFVWCICIIFRIAIKTIREIIISIRFTNRFGPPIFLLNKCNPIKSNEQSEEEDENEEDKNDDEILFHGENEMLSGACSSTIENIYVHYYLILIKCARY